MTAIFCVKAHKIKLNPTPVQEIYFWRAAGVARFAFNWGLARYNEILDWNREHPETKQQVSGRLLRKRFTAIKPEWVSEVTAWAYIGAFEDLQAAFVMFWKKQLAGSLPPARKPRGDGRPHGWPRFKARNHTTPAFYLSNQIIRFTGHFITFDVKRVGPVNMAEEFRFSNGRILGGRISYSQGRWWLAVQVEIEHEPEHGDGAVGIDLGIKYLAVTSDGQVVDNPKALQQSLRKLRRMQRKLDRQRRANNPANFDEKGRAMRGKEWATSARMKETETKIAKTNARIANLRREIAHQFTTDIIRNNEIIGIEDLNIRGLMANYKLAKAIADAGLYEKRRQLEYKAAQNGAILVPVSRWYPSSKMCNKCGWVNTGLKLWEREWTCGGCGQVNHRDGNAAANLRDEALRILENDNRRRTTLAET
ncbi:MAG: IS607 family transposase ISCARN56 [Anaerolineae bacterium]|nr:IS607 family transposase ISCARN56 [Anaerolineae bacterium]